MTKLYELVPHSPYFPRLTLCDIFAFLNFRVWRDGEKGFLEWVPSSTYVKRTLFFAFSQYLMARSLLPIMVTLSTADGKSSRAAFAAGKEKMCPTFNHRILLFCTIYSRVLVFPLFLAFYFPRLGGVKVWFSLKRILAFSQRSRINNVLTILK